MMAAHLRLPESQSDADKETYVDSLIARLGMTKSAHTIVGDAKARVRETSLLECTSFMSGEPNLLRWTTLADRTGRLMSSTGIGTPCQSG